MNNNLLAIDLRSRFFGTNTGAQSLGASPGSLISGLLPNLLVIAGILFLFMIIVGGYSIISNSGSGNAQETAKAKQAVTYGVIGFLIIVTAYFILQIVGYSLGINFTNLPTNLN